MRYCDISKARAVYAAGGNVTEYLRRALGERANTDAIIEIAYDLQAGSYVEHFEKHGEVVGPYLDEIAGVLGRVATGARRILDVGTGESTTLAGVAPRSFAGAAQILACDISWSRLHTGRAFIAASLAADLARRIQLFVGNAFRLPLRTGSIDLVWTSHALEPNGGREREVLGELFRVAKRLCLFEPSYEENSAEGRERMDRLGYVRDLPGAIRDLGGVLEESFRIQHAVNPLNPTHAYVIAAPPRDGRGDTDEQAEATPDGEYWACPATRYPAVLEPDLLYCERSGLAYPVLRGIPVLREESGILATALGRSGPRAGASS